MQLVRKLQDGADQPLKPWWAVADNGCGRSPGSCWWCGMGRRSTAARPWKASWPRARRHVEHIPGYAPDLNPADGVRNLLKRPELKSRCCPNLADLRWQLGLSFRHLQRKRHLIRACFARCGSV